MMPPYAVMVQYSPRGEWMQVCSTENLDHALVIPVQWVREHALRTKGTAQVRDARGRLVFEAIGDAWGERIQTVRRYPPRLE